MLLQDWRLKQCMSQSKLGEKLGVAWTTIWRWESGRSYPMPGHLKKISELTGGQVTAADFTAAPPANVQVSVDELMGIGVSEDRIKQIIARRAARGAK